MESLAHIDRITHVHRNQPHTGQLSSKTTSITLTGKSFRTVSRAILSHGFMELKMTVTIVICTRKRPFFLRKCLEAIANLEPAPNEVIVVDNTSGDTETESIARGFSARYIVEPIPGLSRARNRGLTESRFEIVAYLDDDAVPDKRWLEFMLEPFADPDVAVVTGKVISSKSSAGAFAQEPARSLSNKDYRWFEIAAFGSMGGIGASMALRKAACMSWKVFDERLGRGAPLLGNEEHHAFVGLLLLDNRAVHVPAAVIFHPSKPRSDEQESACRLAYWWLLFFEFPGHRLGLIRYLFRHLLRISLNGSPIPPGSGYIATCGWRGRIKVGLSGTLLYLRNRKSKVK
jgi:glycosyltransferase involved in cell wall biosynthesis